MGALALVTLGGFLAPGRVVSYPRPIMTDKLCCGKLTQGMLPGWCLYVSDSNLGSALPAGCKPALFSAFLAAQIPLP